MPVLSPSKRPVLSLSKWPSCLARSDRGSENHFIPILDELRDRASARPDRP